MFKKKDLTGQKFGHFTIIECTGKGKFGEYLWKGVCLKCKIEKIATGVNFKKLKNKDCPKEEKKKVGGILHPKPKRLNLEFTLDDPIEEHRKFDCIFYDHCLDYSCTMHYINFSCNACEHFFKTSMEEE